MRGFLLLILPSRTHCNSWAKRTRNGRMVGYWPGSAVHQRAALANPRFEDFDYASFDHEEDILAWFGDGTVVAQNDNSPSTGYLDHPDILPIPKTVLSTPSCSSPDNESFSEIATATAP